jgi:phage N-6-adenine-methyltransferase
MGLPETRVLAEANRRESFVLSKMEYAKRLLAETKSIDEVKAIRDTAEALRLYAKQAGLSLAIQNLCAEIKLRAERRAGELLGQLPREPGRRTDLTTSSRGEIRSEPTYTQLLQHAGIDDSAAYRYQRVAAVPQPIFERYIAKTRLDGEELSRTGLLREQHISVHYSSEQDEWLSPRSIIVRVQEVFGEIDLDPCSNPVGEPNVPAKTYFTAADNGLQRSWHGRVFINPPYSQIVHWIEKLHDEFECGRVTEAITLVPSRTDTGWFVGLRDAVICFVRGRLAFSGSRNTAPFPSAVAYFGPDLDRFQAAFDDLGDIWVRRDG